MKRSNVIVFKSVFLIVVCLCAVLTGCQKTTVKDHTRQEPLSKNIPAPIDSIKSALENDFSFTISYEYTNFPIYGISQHVEQLYGADDSFRFYCESRQWDYRNGYEFEENAEYYYQYEDDVFVCYMTVNGGEVIRTEIPQDGLQSMFENKWRMVGSDALLPAYFEAFTEEVKGELYTFKLPVGKVLEGDSYLSVFTNNMFKLSGNEYDSSLELNILCSCKVEKGSYRPIEISYDFTEIKPYVLTSGAMSGEYALDANFVSMIYEFDYDLPQTISVPDKFLNS